MPGSGPRPPAVALPSLSSPTAAPQPPEHHAANVAGRLARRARRASPAGDRGGQGRGGGRAWRRGEGEWGVGSGAAAPAGGCGSETAAGPAHVRAAGEPVPAGLLARAWGHRARA